MASRMYFACIFGGVLLTTIVVGQPSSDSNVGDRDRQGRRGGSPSDTISTSITSSSPTLPSDFFQPVARAGVTCRQRNKCSQRQGLDLDFYDQNCFCDDLCKVYADCCKDHDGSLPASFPQGFKLSKRTLSCDRVIPIDQTAEIYRVNKCPKDYDDAFVREKCEDSHSLDQFLEIPVSGVDTGILYKNYYCAICAGADNLVFWNVKWQCETGPAVKNVTITEKLLEDVWIMGAGNCIYEFSHPTMTYRKCKSHLSRCPRSWEGDASVERKCRQTTAYTYIDSLLDRMVFGNEFCAQCYGINSTYLTCKDPRGAGIRDNRPSINPEAPFTILLDIPTGTGVIQTRDGEGEDVTVIEQHVVFRQCEEHHVYDPFNKICRRVACPPNEFFIQGHCMSEEARRFSSTSRATTRLVQAPPDTLTTRRVRPSTRRATAEDLFTPRPPTTTSRRKDAYDERIMDTYGDVVLSVEGEPFVPKDTLENTGFMSDCPLMPYSRNEYTTFKNMSILILAKHRLYDEGSYILQANTVYVCSPRNITEEDWHMDERILMFQFNGIQKLVCMIGIIVSLLFLLICFVVHMMLPAIRTVPGKCVISLSVTVFIGHAVFLVTVLELGVQNEIACTAMGAVMHYMFIAAFCWTNCLAVDICKAFGGNPSTVQEEKTSIRFSSYSVYAWLFPAFLVGGCVTVDLLDFTSLGVEEEVDMFRPYYGDGVCWISRRNALLFLFAAPLGVLLLVNIITYIVTLCNMCNVPVGVKTVARREKDKNKFLLYVKYCLVLSLTWTFGLLSVLLKMEFLWYIFILFLTLQGLFLCAAFTCTRKVFRLLKSVGRSHKTAASTNSNSRPYHRAYSSATTSSPWAYNGTNFVYEGMDAKVVSQETTI